MQLTETSMWIYLLHIQVEAKTLTQFSRILFPLQALTSHDSNRTRIWFPMFSYFESSVDGIIPNEYSTLESICCDIFFYVTYFKDCCMLTARRFWLAQTHLSPKSILRLSSRSDDSPTEPPANVLNATTGGESTPATTFTTSANINILNNLHNINNISSNINKKLQGNGKFLLLTNNEIRDEVLKNVDNFNNIDARITRQQYSKKDNWDMGKPKMRIKKYEKNEKNAKNTKIKKKKTMPLFGGCESIAPNLSKTILCIWAGEAISFKRDGPSNVRFYYNKNR